MNLTTDRSANVSGESRNTAVVKSFFTETHEGQLESAFHRYAHPDLAWSFGSGRDDSLQFVIPWAGRTYKGHDGYVSLFSMLFAEFENVVFETRRFTDAGEAVSVEGYFLLRQRRTGKFASADWLARVDMRKHRIGGGQLYWNTYALAAARVEV